MKLRRDRFYKARGGTAQLLALWCSACGARVCTYQKDGKGALLRLYWDRILASEVVPDYRVDASRNEMTALKCPCCRAVLALPMVYEPERRLAWQLGRSTIRKSRQINRDK